MHRSPSVLSFYLRRRIAARPSLSCSFQGSFLKALLCLTFFFTPIILMTMDGIMRVHEPFCGGARRASRFGLVVVLSIGALLFCRTPFCFSRSCLSFSFVCRLDRPLVPQVTLLPLRRVELHTLRCAPSPASDDRSLLNRVVILAPVACRRMLMLSFPLCVFPNTSTPCPPSHRLS